MAALRKTVTLQIPDSVPGDTSEDIIEKGSDVSSFRTSDVRQRQEFAGWTLLFLAFQTIGTVYGDIGTSPLYVFSSTFTESPTAEETLCAVSLIIYSLTIMVTIKYAFIVLFADDAGEGGTFSLYSLLARYAKIEDRQPGKATKELDRYKTGDLSRPAVGIRKFFESSTAFKRSVRLAAIFGICAVMADGVFTPAQSVLGAIQGVRVYNEDLSTNAIIGITIAILVLLFAVQPFGINRLAVAYAPIVTLWLLFNVACAIYNFAIYGGTIFKAFNPYYAGRFFIVAGSDVAFHRLGGILLCFTGVEALFADLGAFSRKSIQFSWLFFTYPCLLLTYLGQAANISVIPDNFANPFFLTLPPGIFWPGLILSILAAIVASQAMITGSFQILSQAMHLSYFPRITLKFTSKVVHNQVYVPLANWLLMIGCIIVTGVFNNTTSLGNAYGLCVVLVTVITTCLTSLVAIIVWKFKPFLVVLPIFLIFITSDGLWLSISLFKVPDGAWVTVLIAAGLALVMIIWRTGKSWQWAAEDKAIAAMRQNVADFNEQHQCTQIPGTGIFFDEMDDKIPPIFDYWVRSLQSVHKVTLFVHLRQTYHPTVLEEERYTVTSVPSLANTYKVLVRYGYNEARHAMEAAAAVIDAVDTFLDREVSNSQTGSMRHDKAIERQSVLNLAKAEKAPAYFFGRKDIQVKGGTKNPIRRFIIFTFSLIRDVMVSKPRLWKLESDRIIEVGKAVVL